MADEDGFELRSGSVRRSNRNLPGNNRQAKMLRWEQRLLSQYGASTISSYQ